MSDKKVLILDYGAGNVASLKFALERLGVEVVISDHEEAIAKSEYLFIPGVGAAGQAMQKIREKGLVDIIKAYEKPVLGICLGMQLMCAFSEEDQVNTLNIFPDQVERFSKSPKIPHLGWNQIEFQSHSLFDKIPQKSHFYFVHSFKVTKSEFNIANCNYGAKFVAVMNRDNFYGCQFHPEKSHLVGQQFLTNFLKL
ncbi:MAG: imidazole glycerol phosphate synthase subunit HisH [Bacteroidota bacterium]